MASFFDTDRDIVVNNLQVKGSRTTGLLSSVVVPAGTLAIPVTARFVQKATGGAEALTLANGKPGQRLTINISAYVGNGTLTPTTKTGFTNIVFAAAGQKATLEYVDDTVGWIVEGVAGAAAVLPLVTP